MNLQNKYSRYEFIDFITSFVPNFQKDVRGANTRGLKVTHEAHFLGESPDLDLAIFELKHTSTSDARVTLATEGFRLMKDSANYRALIAYVPEKSDDWRLSLMTLTPEPNEKGKVTVQISNPRRYSFFLGPNSKVHTPKSFLIDKGKVENFEDLTERFNVEVVTKEFFGEYKRLFDKLSENLKNDRAFQIFAERSKIDTNNFAKKLLGQVVFLYFLQRKGWLGAAKGESISNGDRSFMRSYFDKARKSGEDYFNSHLEPLFYNALNQRSNKAGSFYREEFGCQIPFLNGGLFEPLNNYNWRKDYLNIPDKFFSSNPDNPEKGDGILDVFDLYNFTVDESDPTDKEVSVDPEMLGKVFENLLEENLRKGKGTYYTPREIVHYMCQESLINYLVSNFPEYEKNIKNLIKFGEYSPTESPRVVIMADTANKKIDDLLKTIRVVDPACGSGAFLVSMLQEIIKARMFLARLRNEDISEYELKKETIQNCIYGVDIDPSAVEIAKLRLWLSLVVDYELEDIEPLPNLDYKIMVGNSLIEILSPELLARSTDTKRNELIDRFNKDKADYYSISDTDQKRQKRQEINLLAQAIVNYDRKKEADSVWQKILGHRSQTRLFGEEDKQSTLAEAELTKELKKLEGLNNNFSETDHFEWHLNFNEIFEKGGFDVVIANPPYIGFHGIKEIRKQLVDNFKSARGKFDIYIVFIERGLQLTKPRGFVTYICPTNFMKRSHGESLRKLLASESQITEITDFGHEQIFESVTNYTGILILQKGNPAFDHTLTYKTKLLDDRAMTFEQRKLGGKTWVIRTKDVSEIVEKLEKFEALETLADSISEGVVTGFNKFYLLSKKEIARYKFETTYFRKCLRGKEVRKNVILPCDYFVFYPYENVHGKTKVIEEARLKKECPNYYKFLNSNKKEILNRDYFKESNKLWFELWNQRDISQLETNKILTPELSPTNNFALGGKDDFYGDTVCGITLNNGKISPKSLLAILNSKLIEFYYKSTTVPKAGGFYIYKVMYLNDIPIAIPNKEQTDQLDELQTRILHQSNNDAEKYEGQINQLVYKLYVLTPEEIEIVEGKNES